MGPFTVSEHLGKGLYRLKNQNGEVIKKANINHLKLYKRRNDSSSLLTVPNKSVLPTKKAVPLPEKTVPPPEKDVPPPKKNMPLPEKSVPQEKSVPPLEKTVPQPKMSVPLLEMSMPPPKKSMPPSEKRVSPPADNKPPSEKSMLQPADKLSPPDKSAQSSAVNMASPKASTSDLQTLLFDSHLLRFWRTGADEQLYAPKEDGQFDVSLLYQTLVLCSGVLKGGSEVSLKSSLNNTTIEIR